jgi:hypothetical protein
MTEAMTRLLAWVTLQTRTFYLTWENRVYEFRVDGRRVVPTGSFPVSASRFTANVSKDGRIVFQYHEPGGIPDQGYLGERFACRFWVHVVATRQEAQNRVRANLATLVAW